MYSYHQKPLCVLLVSIAVIVYFSSLKNIKHENLEISSEAQNNLLYQKIPPALSVSEPDEFSLEYNQTFNVLFALESLDNSTAFERSKFQITKVKIYILGLFELSDNRGKRDEGFQELQAAEAAVKHVNDLNVLPGYELVLLANDTNCDAGVALDRIFNAIYTQPPIIMLLGAGCSNVSETLAHVVPYWNILQVSPGSNSPSLSDRTKFPLFFRTESPDSTHNLAKIHIIKKFKWHVVVTFTQSEGSYLLPMNNFITELESENVSCIASITFSAENYKEQLKILRGFDVRIIIGSFSEKMAMEVFCAAYDLNMFADDYVWIVQKHENIWNNYSTPDCYSQNIIQSMSGLFTTSVYDYHNYHEALQSAIERQMNLENKNLSKYVWQTYDAVWTIALTLKESSADYLENFHYGRKDMACDFFQKMTRLTFMGLSGPVKFNGPDRIGDLIISQIQNGKLKPVALFESLKNGMDFHCQFCHKIAWSDPEHIPVAQRILKLRLVKIPKIMYGIVALLTILGICLALTFLYFNLKYRRMKTLKISSPKLNSLAVVGCVLVYVSIILFRVTDVIPETKLFFNEICSLQTFLLSAGFCLTFGSIFAKCYRVHRLLVGSTASLVRNKLLKDNHMIALILTPLLADAILMTLWINVDPLQKHLHNLVLEKSVADRRVTYQPQVEVCLCRNTIGWYVALFGYKVLIVTMGVYMAWKTRNIKVSVLNDSQHIGICVYSVVFCTIIVVFFSLLKEYVIVSYLARNVSVLTATTVTLILLFLTKIKSIFNKVDTEESLMQSLGLKIEYRTRRFLIDDPKELIHRLEIQNRVYQTRLETLQSEISHLENLASESSSNIDNTLNSELYILNIPEINVRSSWPSAHTNTIKAFCSEDRLASEKLHFFGKLRHLFESIRSVNIAEERDGRTMVEQTKKEFGSITF